MWRGYLGRICEVIGKLVCDKNEHSDWIQLHVCDKACASLFGLIVFKDQHKDSMYCVQLFYLQLGSPVLAMEIG